MNRNKNKFTISFILATIPFFVVSFDIYTLLGISLFVFFSSNFFIDIGKKIDIRELMIILASLQWIIGPILAYTYYPDNQFYYMAVDIKTYMSFVVPATGAFALGMFLPVWKKPAPDNYFLHQIRIFVRKYKNIDIILIIIGSVSELIIDFVPAGVRFAFFLLSGLRFIGLYFLFLTDRKHKQIYIYVVLGWLFLVSLRETLFHDLLLWLGFFVLIVAFIKKPSYRQKFIYLLAILILAAVIQTVKYSYRETIEKTEAENLEIFAQLVEEQVFDLNYLSSDANLSGFVTRINQGWIIARIMSWTPSREPFADGETITEAIKASLMPRILFPGKVKAGGRTYFTRFTGKPISEKTSMGLGLLGEAYANYGVFGGIIFMFIIGFFYNFFIHKIYKAALKHPTIIFFIPLIFLQVVKAETDFSVILNHLLKATVIVWFIFWSFNKFLKIRI
jgi:hypothetical protein